MQTDDSGPSLFFLVINPIHSLARPCLLSPVPFFLPVLAVSAGADPDPVVVVLIVS